MKLALQEGFQRDAARLTATERSAVLDAMLSLPRALGSPHTHMGLGIRKLHRSGIWECRVGLGLRLVFTLEPGVLTLVRLGTHHEIRRYLRDL